MLADCVIAWRPSLSGWRPLLLGWRPLLVGSLSFQSLRPHVSLLKIGGRVPTEEEHSILFGHNRFYQLAVV